MAKTSNAGREIDAKSGASIPALKMEFTAIVEAEDRPALEVLRALMRRYVEEAKRRRFTAKREGSRK